ncbi:hypothetical protein XaC1_115 [Xanthomonas phage XaC1]|nr:hypothetical protein XaC1_115 [Xanthomonas phage XaC1]
MNIESLKLLFRTIEEFHNYPNKNDFYNAVMLSTGIILKRNEYSSEFFVGKNEVQNYGLSIAVRNFSYLMINFRKDSSIACRILYESGHLKIYDVHSGITTDLEGEIGKEDIFNLNFNHEFAIDYEFIELLNKYHPVLDNYTIKALINV